MKKYKIKIFGGIEDGIVEAAAPANSPPFRNSWPALRARVEPLRVPGPR